MGTSNSLVTMDPVLSSTIDFDEYIKKNLQLTGTKAPTTSVKTNRPQSANSKKSSNGRQGIATENLSHEFLQLNLRKYGHPSALGQPASKAQGGSSNSNGSPTPVQVPLQHSWRAHLLSRPATARAQDKTIATTNDGFQVQSRHSLEWSDAAKNYPVGHAPDSPQHKLSNSPERHKVRSARVHLRSADGAESKSLGADEFGEYRVRMVTLQRMFRTWLDNCTRSKRQLALASRDVLENALYWPKYTAWVWWKYLHWAVSFRRNACRRRAIERFWRNYKLSKRRHLQLRRAHRLYAFVKASQFLQRLVLLGKKRRARNLAHAKRIRAHNFRNTRLARAVLVAWKQLVHKIKTDRLLDAEQAARRDKIAAFMRRVQTPQPPAAAPASGASTATAGPGRSASAGRKLPPARQVQEPLPPSRIPRRDGAQAKESSEAARPIAGTSRLPQRAGAFAEDKATQRSSRGATSSSASRSTDDHQQDRRGVAERDYKQMTDQPSDEEEVYGEDFEQYEGSDGDDARDALEESEAPPSYDTLVRSSHQSGRSAGPARSTPRRSEEDASPPTPPVTARSAASQRRGTTTTTGTSARGGTQRHSTGYSTAPVESTAHMSLEERAAARRERTLQLKRQAEERVQGKAQQRAALEMEKRQREIEEEEALRKEARAKQLQAKALHDRQRADQAEVLKELVGRAKRFRATQLLVRWGLAPWQQYMELVRFNNSKADSYRADRLLQSAWTALLGYVISRRTERYRWEHRHTALAVAHYRRKLLKFVWRTFRLHHKHLVAKSRALTGHFSRFTLCRRSFHAWRVAYERSIRLEVRQLRSVQPRGDFVRKRYYFRQWHSHYLGQLKEREIRMRVNSKWAAVQSWMGNA